MNIDKVRKRIDTAHNLLGEVDEMLECGDADALAPLTVLDVAKSETVRATAAILGGTERKRCRILIDLGARAALKIGLRSRESPLCVSPVS